MTAALRPSAADLAEIVSIETDKLLNSENVSAIGKIDMAGPAPRLAIKKDWKVTSASRSPPAKFSLQRSTTPSFGDVVRSTTLRQRSLQARTIELRALERLQHRPGVLHAGCCPLPACGG